MRISNKFYLESNEEELEAVVSVELEVENDLYSIYDFEIESSSRELSNTEIDELMKMSDKFDWLDLARQEEYNQREYINDRLYDEYKDSQLENEEQ